MRPSRFVPSGCESSDPQHAGRDTLVCPPHCLPVMSGARKIPRGDGHVADGRKPAGFRNPAPTTHN